MRATAQEQERARAAELLAARWPAGVCHYCDITDDQVDGDRRRWLDMGRKVCSDPGCVKQFSAELARAEAQEARRSRKRRPGEIHELILEEVKLKRRQYREAAKARRAGRVA